ncbi:Caspase recruitment domain, member 6 [Cichlidogyrus casuarinus]|uniref:Caspase recruitment domain, member 6 n=1 Tax=Cichlidogyrus casuarinus TaxID=1844966 RepID=A0ABD2QND2_9PLAT
MRFRSAAFFLTTLMLVAMVHACLETDINRRNRHYKAAKRLYPYYMMPTYVHSKTYNGYIYHYYRLQRSDSKARMPNGPSSSHPPALFTQTRTIRNSLRPVSPPPTARPADQAATVPRPPPSADQVPFTHRPTPPPPRSGPTKRGEESSVQRPRPPRQQTRPPRPDQSPPEKPQSEEPVRPQQPTPGRRPPPRRQPLDRLDIPSERPPPPTPTNRRPPIPQRDNRPNQPGFGGDRDQNPDQNRMNGPPRDPSRPWENDRPNEPGFGGDRDQNRGQNMMNEQTRDPSRPWEDNRPNQPGFGGDREQDRGQDRMNVAPRDPSRPWENNRPNQPGFGGDQDRDQNRMNEPPRDQSRPWEDNRLNQPGFGSDQDRRQNGINEQPRRDPLRPWEENRSSQQGFEEARSPDRGNNGQLRPWEQNPSNQPGFEGNQSRDPSRPNQPDQERDQPSWEGNRPNEPSHERDDAWDAKRNEQPVNSWEQTGGTQDEATNPPERPVDSDSAIRNPIEFDRREPWQQNRANEDRQDEQQSNWTPNPRAQVPNGWTGSSHTEKEKQGTQYVNPTPLSPREERQTRPGRPPIKEGKMAIAIPIDDKYEYKSNFEGLVQHSIPNLDEQGVETLRNLHHSAKNRATDQDKTNVSTPDLGYDSTVSTNQNTKTEIRLPNPDPNVPFPNSEFRFPNATGFRRTIRDPYLSRQVNLAPDNFKKVTTSRPLPFQEIPVTTPAEYETSTRAPVRVTRDVSYFDPSEYEVPVTNRGNSYPFPERKSRNA